MTDPVRLPVGHFSAEGGVLRYEEVVGQKIAEIDEHEESPTTCSTLQTHLQVFRAGDSGPYFVHSLLETRGRHRPLLGRLDQYGSLAEVLEDHPKLFRSAGYATGPPAPRIWPRPDATTSESARELG